MYFEINGQPYKTEIKGLTVLQACLEAGVQIPRFCFHEKLCIAGNCRMCLVELAANPRSKKPIASCALPLSNNMIVYTNTILVKKARESVLEFLLINHPLDCPICDQGGECDLQDQSFIFGNDKSRFYQDKRSVSDKFFGPFIKTIMTRCIHCTRCVRFASEIAGIDFLGVTGRGSSMEIGSYIDKIFNSELSGNVIDLCPVGALTSKTYAFVARPWELRSTESFDFFDTFGTRIKVDSRGLEILRILPSYNRNTNDEWITDKVRFSYDGLKKQRLKIPMIKNAETFLFTEISWIFAFNLLAENLNNFHFFDLTKNNNFFFSISFVFGNFVDLGLLLLLKKFFSFFNFNGARMYSQNFFQKIKIDMLKFYFFENYSLFENKNFDGLFLFLFNPRLEIPLFNLKIRKSFLNNNNFLVVSFGYVTNLTYRLFNFGNTLIDLNNFIKGKLTVCRKSLYLKNPLFLINENLSIFLGKNFYPFFQYLIDISKFLLPVKFYSISSVFKIIFSKTNFLNEKSLDFFNFANFSGDKNNSLFFLLNTDINLKTVNKRFFLKNFYIFLGSHGNSDAELSDMIFPSTIFSESIFYSLNLEGKLQFSQFSTIAPIGVREMWRIFYDFFIFFFEKLKFNLRINKIKLKFFINYDRFFIFKMVKIYYLFKSFNILFNIKFSKKLNENFFKDIIYSFYNINYKIQTFFFFLPIEFFIVFFIKNKIFLINISSYYKNDVITRSSKFMNLAFLEFEKKELNFF